MTYRLSIEPLGEALEVAEEQTLLDAALRAGIHLPHACGHGLCGTCKVQVLEGEVEHGNANTFALMDSERDDGYALACCATPVSDLVIEADVEEEPDARVEPVEDYVGRIVEIRDLTPTAKAVFIELDRDLTFQAGKYVNLHLPGIERPRAFSLANAPSEKRRIELNVRRVSGGAATEYIHERLAVGDEVRLAGPYGRFFVRRSAPEDIIFFAGGTGLSSPKSMILDLLESGDERRITLVYGARNRAELYYHELLTELAGKYPNFIYVPALSEPSAEDVWDGAVGFVHEVAKSHFGGMFAGHKAYLCGPPPMIDACLTALMRGRLFERDIYQEKFINAADAADTGRRSPLFRSI